MPSQIVIAAREKKSTANDDSGGTDLSGWSGMNLTDEEWMDGEGHSILDSLPTKNAEPQSKPGGNLKWTQQKKLEEYFI